MLSAANRDQQPSGSNICPQRPFPVHLTVNKNDVYSKTKLPSAIAICERISHMRASMDGNNDFSSGLGVSAPTYSTATAGHSQLEGTLNTHKKGNNLSSHHQKSGDRRKGVCGDNDSQAMEVYKTRASILLSNKCDLAHWKRGFRYINRDGFRTDVIPKSRTRMLPLPYHDILCSPIVSTPLYSCYVVYSYDSQKYIFSFDEALTSRILDSKNNSSDVYGTQVLVRFCMDDWSCKQAADVPACIVIVNGKKALLQKKNLQNVGPLDITSLCELTRGEESVNILHIEWMRSLKKRYCMSVSVGEKLSVPGTVSKLMKENVQGACITRKMVQDKLKSDTPDVSFTSLKAKLTCPVGKTRLVTPCRGSACTHLQCMDALTLLKLYEGRPLSSKKCYMCDKPFGNIVVDGLFLEILQSVPKSVDEVEFNEDGSWSYTGDTGYHCLVRMSEADQCKTAGDEHSSELPSDNPLEMEPTCSAAPMKIESITEINAALKTQVNELQSQMDKLEDLSRKHEQGIDDDLDETDTSICDLTVDAIEAMSTKSVSEVYGSHEICCIQLDDDVESSKSVVDLTNDQVDRKPDVNLANRRLGSRVKVKRKSKCSSPQNVEQCVEVEISRLLKISKGLILLKATNKTGEKNKFRRNGYMNKDSKHFDAEEDSPHTVGNDKDVNQDDSTVVIFESDTTDDEDIIEIGLNLDKCKSLSQSDQTDDVDKSTNLMSQTAEKEKNFMKEDGTYASVSDYDALYVEHCLAYMTGSSNQHELTENDNAEKKALYERVSNTKSVTQDETDCVEMKTCFEIVPDIDSVTKDQTHIVTKGSRSIDELLNIKMKHDGTAERWGTDGKFDEEILNSGGKLANKCVDLNKAVTRNLTQLEQNVNEQGKVDKVYSYVNPSSIKEMKDTQLMKSNDERTFLACNTSKKYETRKRPLEKTYKEHVMIKRDRKYQSLNEHSILKQKMKNRVLLDKMEMDRLHTKVLTIIEEYRHDTTTCNSKRKPRCKKASSIAKQNNVKCHQVLSKSKDNTGMWSSSGSTITNTNDNMAFSLAAGSVGKTVSSTSGSKGRKVSTLTAENEDKTVSLTSGSKGRQMSLTAGSKGRKVSPLTAESVDKTVSLTSGSKGRQMSLTSGSKDRKVSLTAGSKGRKVSLTAGSKGRKVSLTAGSKGRKVSPLTAESEDKTVALTSGSVNKTVSLTSGSKGRKTLLTAGSKGRRKVSSLTAESEDKTISLTSGIKGRKMSLNTGSRGRKMSLTARSKGRKGCCVTEIMETDAQSMDDITSLHNTWNDRNSRKRTLLVDNLTTLPDHWFAHHMFNDTVDKMNLAPPTKRLMKIMESGMVPWTCKDLTWLKVYTNASEMMKRPGLPLQSLALRNLFDRNLLSSSELPVIADDHSEEILAEDIKI